MDLNQLLKDLGEIRLSVIENDIERAGELLDFVIQEITIASQKPKRSRPRKKDYYNPRDVAILGGDPSL